MQVGFKEEQKHFLIGDCVHLRGLNDREAKRWAEPEERSDKHQRGARMPGQRRAGQLVRYIFEWEEKTSKEGKEEQVYWQSSSGFFFFNLFKSFLLLRMLTVTSASFYIAWRQRESPTGQWSYWRPITAAGATTTACSVRATCTSRAFSWAPRLRWATPSLRWHAISTWLRQLCTLSACNLESSCAAKFWTRYSLECSWNSFIHFYSSIVWVPLSGSIISRLGFCQSFLAAPVCASMYALVLCIWLWSMIDTKPILVSGCA